METESLRTNDWLSSHSCTETMTADQAFLVYADMVYRLAFSRTKNRYYAEDVLQEVFMRYLRSKPSFESDDHRKAWFLRVTINCTKTYLTTAWFRHVVPLTDTLTTEAEPTGEVYDAVMRLPVKYRTVIHLFYYEDYTVEQIAAVCKSKVSTVKSQLHRARALLREQLKGADQDVF